MRSYAEFGDDLILTTEVVVFIQEPGSRLAGAVSAYDAAWRLEDPVVFNVHSTVLHAQKFGAQDILTADRAWNPVARRFSKQRRIHDLGIAIAEFLEAGGLTTTTTRAYNRYQAQYPTR